MLFSFPQTLSRYQPIVEIGKGAMAEVILAQMRVGRGLQKLVVLKRIWPDLAAESEFMSMFLREARIGARMNHPNIVQTHEVLEDTDRPAIAMEYLDGQPLTRVMNRLVTSGGLTPTLRLLILAKVLIALDYAHELTDYDGSPQGVVHRDVNPKNIFVTYDGRVKLVDFGQAKSLSAAYQTRAGGRASKISYMAPEQVRGGRIDRRADIFAAGIVLWEVMSGRRFWQDMDDETIVRHLTSRIPLRQLPPNPNLPGELGQLTEVCARALSLEPEARFETAAAFAYELQRMVTGSDDSHIGQLGKIVSLAFAGERAARRSTIRQHLRQDGAPLEKDHALAASPGRPSSRSVPVSSETEDRRLVGVSREGTGPVARLQAARRLPARLPPPHAFARGDARGQPRVAIWSEGEGGGNSSPGSGQTQPIDPQSIISIEPLDEQAEPQDAESSLPTAYVPRAISPLRRWGAVGAGATLALVLGVVVVQIGKLQPAQSKGGSPQTAQSSPFRGAIVAPQTPWPTIALTDQSNRALGPNQAAGSRDLDRFENTLQRTGVQDKRQGETGSRVKRPAERRPIATRVPLMESPRSSWKPIALSGLTNDRPREGLRRHQAPTSTKPVEPVESADSTDESVVAGRSSAAPAPRVSGVRHRPGDEVLPPSIDKAGQLAGSEGPSTNEPATQPKPEREIDDAPNFTPASVSSRSPRARRIIDSSDPVYP